MDDSEDLVQDVFVDIYQNKRLQNVKNVEHYLLRAVKFSCYDYIKKKRLSISSKTHDSEDIEPDIEDFETEKIYTYIIASLPPKTRQVFLLHRESGLSYKEISEKLMISIKTVEAQMSRAIKISRRILKNLDLI